MSDAPAAPLAASIHVLKIGGGLAALHGRARSRCPYGADTLEGIAWLWGWDRQAAVSRETVSPAAAPGAVPGAVSAPAADPAPDPRGKIWAPAELAFLRQARAEGITFEEIGQALGRPGGACRNRASRVQKSDIRSQKSGDRDRR